MTKEEFKSLYGEKEYTQYIIKVYNGEINIEEVPLIYRDKVQFCVLNREQKNGVHPNKKIQYIIPNPNSEKGYDLYTKEQYELLKGK